MKIQIRPEIGIPMCNCAAKKKMEAIGFLVPKLQSELRSEFGTQLFEKTQCFYVATVNFNVSVYYFVTKIYTCSCKKAAWKSAKTVGKTVGAYIVSMDRKTTVYGQDAGKIAFFWKKNVQAGHSNMFPYFTGLPAEPGFIIQHDTVQTPR